MHVTAQGLTQMSELSVRELQVRLLVPFLVPLGTNNEIREWLSKHQDTGKQPWVIETKNPHPGAYSQELLSDLNEFLFGNNSHSCVYARLDRVLAQKWFRNQFRVVYERRLQLSSNFRTAILLFPGIELFLSPLGAGVLSLSFRLADEGPVSFVSALTFTHDFAQLIPQKSPTIEFPLAHGEPTALEPHSQFESRAGKRGGSLHLFEVVDFLLSPIRQMTHLRLVQSQCSSYTVVRCGAECDFKQERTRDALGSFLSSLSQIEEGTHPGEATSHISVPNGLLNSRHWAAVSSIGTAHVIADQSDNSELPFDSQRMSNVRDKYFIPYLIALLQRLALANLVHEAQRVAAPPRSSESIKPPKARVLREYMLRLSTQFAAYAVSSRDALNRYYRLSCDGVELEQALTATLQTVEALEDCEQADFQTEIASKIDENVSALASMQRGVGWLEVFFAAVYGMELFRALGEGLGFTPHYISLTAVAWGVTCGGAAAVIAKPWQHERIVRSSLVAAILLVAILMFLWVKFAPR